MLPRTHRLIGKMIYTTVQKAHYVKLRRMALEYGSIMPDMKPSLKTVPHTFDHSFFLVKELIISLTSNSTPLTKGEMRAFSKTLGILLHFLSDYFCFLHNNSISVSLRKHYLYERKLAKRMKDHFERNSCYPFSALTNPALYFQSAEDLIEYVEKMHKIYLSKEHRLSHDIEFSIEVCSAVSSAIVRNKFYNDFKYTKALTG